MATPFSNTLRSLDADQGPWPLTGLITAMLLAAVWGYWLFSAGLVSYESSRALTVSSETRQRSHFPRGETRTQTFSRQTLSAQFSPAAATNIHPGQRAFVRWDDTATPVSATVRRVENRPGFGPPGRPITVILNAETDAAAAFVPGGAGEVKIEVEHRTPATVILQASGLLTETPPLSVSPQAIPRHVVR